MVHVGIPINEPYFQWRLSNWPAGTAGCMTYTHTYGARNRFMEFSRPILKDNKPAGILAATCHGHHDQLRKAAALRGWGTALSLCRFDEETSGMCDNDAQM